MKSKNQKTLKVLPKTHEQLKFISKGSGLTITEFLDELINEIFVIAASYPNNFNINYLPSISGSYVMVQCLGKGRVLLSGKFLIPKSMTEPQKEMTCNLLDDAMTAKAVENAENAKIEIEKGQDFDSVVQRLNAVNKKSCKVVSCK